MGECVGLCVRTCAHVRVLVYMHVGVWGSVCVCVCVCLSVHRLR